ncbi:hypothetical protein SKAU_G00111880 [Synaphobranchus kaupii]|uniref:Uncharacterized protein n=1 Tax=Synaphobranchus kaupii TaxID=118154 RepID=A0A9Q1J6B1_SYNKA|nr:hypothetical protein SKAU_G00111880 [Synaphobranchus kaupii]
MFVPRWGGKKRRYEEPNTQRAVTHAKRSGCQDVVKVGCGICALRERVTVLRGDTADLSLPTRAAGAGRKWGTESASPGARSKARFERAARPLNPTSKRSRKQPQDSRRGEAGKAQPRQTLITICRQVRLPSERQRRANALHLRRVPLPGALTKPHQSLHSDSQAQLGKKGPLLEMYNNC